ncbi:Hypothetical predicted protein [Octopus vulgaris]|uniref:Uncharacterized protein n=1 Tax=Octopus vulgaris TaxID=6645 RepID=A0AA36B549_OCTVU|nr:Hypothetical predicted protein [Octopus vulgaris]
MSKNEDVVGLPTQKNVKIVEEAKVAEGVTSNEAVKTAKVNEGSPVKKAVKTAQVAEGLTSNEAEKSANVCDGSKPSEKTKTFNFAAAAVTIGEHCKTDNSLKGLSEKNRGGEITPKREDAYPKIWAEILSVIGIDLDGLVWQGSGD